MWAFLAIAWSCPNINYSRHGKHPGSLGTLQVCGVTVIYAVFTPHFEIWIKWLWAIMRLHTWNWLNIILIPLPNMSGFWGMISPLHSCWIYIFNNSTTKTVVSLHWHLQHNFWIHCTQPEDDSSLLAIMKCKMAGGPFEFSAAQTKLLTLQSIAFSSCKTHRNEKLYSYMGKGFFRDWIINKNRHMTWGMKFTWISNGYAIKWFLTYNGANPAVLWFQVSVGTAT